MNRPQASTCTIRLSSCKSQLLVDRGNTVVVIEHNLDLIYCADHVLDLGPEGGRNGGQLVFAGTPEDLIREKASVTGEYLKDYAKKVRATKTFQDTPVEHNV